jgi:sugar phosphate isomerase/epimerase
MAMSRRQWLATGLTLPLTQLVPELGLKAKGKDRIHLGIVSYSFQLRLSADRARHREHERTEQANGDLNDPLYFLEYCHRLGAGGIQLDLGMRDKSYFSKLRQQAQSYGMYLEGSIRLPRDKSDVDRFASEVRTAKEAGAKVIRTVMMSGRRYEIFDSADAFRRAAEQALESLRLAEPMVAREDALLAIENHKDWRVDELVAILRRLRSGHVGVCVDFGNSIALLEDPMEVVEALAPFAFTTHVKDMAVCEYDRGFLLSEVPLGDGFLDLSRMIDTLKRHRADIRFNLEMITRDPLQVPCLDAKYWASSEGLPGKYLARTLSLVRRHKPRQPLPRIQGLSKEQQLELEEKNVQKCLAYAKEQLKL